MEKSFKKELAKENGKNLFDKRHQDQPIQLQVTQNKQKEKKEFFKVSQELFSLYVYDYKCGGRVCVCSQSTNHVVEAPIRLLYQKKSRILLYSFIFLFCVGFVFFLVQIRGTVWILLLFYFLYGWYHLKKNSFMRNSLFFFIFHSLFWFFFFLSFFSFFLLYFEHKNQNENYKKKKEKMK